MSRAPTGEILPAGGGHVPDRTEITLAQELASGLKQWVYMKHVGYGGLSTRPIPCRNQLSYSGQGLRERFFDQHMDSTLQKPRGQLDVKMCRSADDGRVKPGGSQGVLPVIHRGNVVTFRHGLQKARIRVAGSDLSASGSLETAQMALANTATTDD